MDEGGKSEGAIGGKESLLAASASRKQSMVKDKIIFCSTKGRNCQRHATARAPHSAASVGL
jgi:hypothetical protein